MRAALRRVLPTSTAPPEARVVAEEAQWDRYVHDQQARLQTALRAHIPPLILSGPMAHVLHLAVLALVLRLRARMVPFVGDILAYQRPDAKQLITEELQAALMRLAARLPRDEPDARGGDGNAPGRLPAGRQGGRPGLTVIGHSLGTVIASDFLWDARQQPGAFQLLNFFTLGSPMAFYALRYGSGRIEEFDKPLAIAAPGCWVNCYHPADPVATPLRRLNPAYQRAVLHDAEIRNAALFTAHTSYWKDSKVHEVIGEKLALDWLERRSALPPERLAALRRHYEDHLSLI